MIAIIGSEGSMGKRYQAILKYLGEQFIALDKSTHHEESIVEMAKACEHIIIATPTHTHVELLRELLPARRNILCEKPITKDIGALEELHNWCANNGYSYQMVYQYKELPCSDIDYGYTSYDYFRHGSDGLAWDCIQIIGLAKSHILLKEESPWWSCVINGRQMYLTNMDSAYIDMIEKWLSGELNQTMDEILDVHQKVIDYIESQTHATN